LSVGNWSFSGAWILEFGIFAGGKEIEMGCAAATALPRDRGGMLKGECRIWSLEIGAWNFFGIWILKFGI
jgi:hypothetical protein